MSSNAIRGIIVTTLCHCKRLFVESKIFVNCGLTVPAVCHITLPQRSNDMPTDTLTDAIRFRCEKGFRPRLKRIVRKRYGRYAKYQTVARDVLRQWVDNQEKQEAA